MTLTHLSLPRSFLDQIGFTHALREATQARLEPEWRRMFRALAPGWRGQDAQPEKASGTVARFAGYWIAHEQVWASDGLIRLGVPHPAPVHALMEHVREAHFSGRVHLPVAAAPGKGLPTHMLLHDTDLWCVYVAPFEQAEAILVRQRRPW